MLGNACGPAASVLRPRWEEGAGLEFGRRVCYHIREVVAMGVSAVQTRRWTREEYERLAETGIFHPEERVELIDGELVLMTPQKSVHATAVRLVEDALRIAFGSGYDVRAQLPLALDPDSEPEPDVAVVAGAPRDYRDAHPATALLVVEVADTTLTFDRERKGSLYARAGIAEYWIVNLADRLLEVYRDPAPAPSAQYGWSYRVTQRLSPSDSVNPLATSQARIAVSDLLS
jgi:Uma2 family endonuclease